MAYRVASNDYYVYIIANKSGMLYTGVTNDLARRMAEHKGKSLPGYASRYNIRRLVYYEATDDIGAAIAREKTIKGWLRARKVALIESVNPDWRDLTEDW
ncbi:MAG: GIY-YIG nuclease family protein [Gemmatimonadales bacterium]|nr:GIY-YIG nuclease family protein [Gemmatimonadales bacterium]